MPETIKVVKFKTNVSFVDNSGVFRAGSSVVQLPAEEYDAQIDVCEQFDLPAPELIEELDAEVEESVVEEVKKRTRGRAASSPKEEQPSSEVDNEL